ncbi:MAG: DUF2946 family protein [Rhodomicrobium sp.]
MRGDWAYSTRRNARSALRREAVAAFCVFVLLLNTLAGFLSHSHYDATGGLALPLDGSKMAICSGRQMVFVDKDGNALPGQPPQQQHDCACCLLMLSSAVVPPPPAAPGPLELGAIQIMRPADAERLHAAAGPTHRNRGPPSQA